MASVPVRPRPSHASPSSSYYDTSKAASSSSRNPITIKVNRFLSSNLEDAGVRSALDTLGESEDGTNAALVISSSEGGLRRSVDERVGQSSQSFLDAFAKVNDNLSMLQAHLDAMHSACDAVQEQLEKSNDATKYLLDHAQGLRTQRAATSDQQTVVQLFLNRFCLSDAEISAITSPDAKPGPDMFAAMSKTEKIRRDCRALLSGEAGDGSKAGFDIMERTAQHLDAGYNKLHKWCLFESRGYSKESLVVTDTMRVSIQKLRSRPDLLEEVLTTLGNTRATAILNSFLNALTRGGPNGLPRPIELHAHDPTRYVGDMLAWIHQATAGEREFLESLFSVKDDMRRVGSVREQEAKDRDEQSVRQLLDRDLEGCGRPLRMRVLQTIKGQEGSIMLYRIATLIHFYKLTMERTIGQTALLTKTLDELTNEAYDAFYETLKAQSASLLKSIQPPDAVLSAPPLLKDALARLREIMAVYASSLLEGPDKPSSAAQREAGFAEVLTTALEPALDMCAKMADLRPSEWERSIFRINCFQAVLNALDGFAFTMTRVEELESRQTDDVERVTAEHFDMLLAESGLRDLHAALALNEPLEERVPADQARRALDTFDKWLATTDTFFAPPRLALLPPRFATSIHRAALDRVSDAYATVHDAVATSYNSSNENGGRVVLKRSQGDVATLLGVGSSQPQTAVPSALASPSPRALRSPGLRSPLLSTTARQ